MPRIARKKSNSGIYHVIVRGINRQDIFHEEEDYTNRMNHAGEHWDWRKDVKLNNC
ncbi:MAG: transposase IS200-family protein [Firmicutes bacterium]|nr:transposase IS200-family protein [Bacillota bacterium]